MEDDERCSCGGWIDPESGVCEDCGTRHRSAQGFDQWLSWGVGAAAALLVLGLLLLVYQSATWALRHEPPSTASAPARPDEPRPGTTAEVVKRILPSVVFIQTETSVGSGFVFGRAGYILTCAHVVDGASQIRVTDNSGREYRAKVVGIDRKQDLAALAVPDFHAPPLAAGGSEKLLQGEDVIAFGSPLGLENSVSAGIVSGFRNRVPVQDLVYERLIQTTAPIAPGSSGGPLVARTSGLVIGINTAGVDPDKADNIAFAIPMDLARRIADPWVKP